MTFITHMFWVSVVSEVRERVRDLGSPLRFIIMLRRSSLVECVTRNVFTMRQFFFYPSVCAAMFVKKSLKYTFYTIELADACILRYKIANLNVKQKVCSE